MSCSPVSPEILSVSLFAVTQIRSTMKIFTTYNLRLILIGLLLSIEINNLSECCRCIAITLDSRLIHKLYKILFNKFSSKNNLAIGKRYIDVDDGNLLVTILRWSQILAFSVNLSPTEITLSPTSLIFQS